MVRFVCWGGVGGWLSDSRYGASVEMKPNTKGRRKRLVLLHELYVRSMYVADNNKYNRMRRRGTKEARRWTFPPIHRRPSPAPEVRGKARARERKYAVKERRRKSTLYVKQRVRKARREIRKGVFQHYNPGRENGRGGVDQKELG